MTDLGVVPPIIKILSSLVMSDVGNIVVHAAFKNMELSTLRHLLTNVLKTETNLTTDRERFIRSNAPTARPPTLERLVETSTRD